MFRLVIQNSPKKSHGGVPGCPTFCDANVWGQKKTVEKMTSLLNFLVSQFWLYGSKLKTSNGYQILRLETSKICSVPDLMRYSHAPNPSLLRMERPRKPWHSRRQRGSVFWGVPFSKPRCHGPIFNGWNIWTYAWAIPKKKVVRMVVNGIIVGRILLYIYISIKPSKIGSCC